METVGLTDVKFDDKGLVPAVVQEGRSGKVLMVAYMNAESLQKTVESGETWFYSRSRQELWHKGETSGHFQKVRDIFVDCDADTLLVVVDQIGAACHTGSKSCFFRRLDGWDGTYAGSLSMLSDLRDEIEEKKIHPTEKSYTAYLLQTGMDKICKKIGEEATETVIAAKNNSKDELIYEASDLLYHLTVLLNNQGVSWDELFEELTKRHQKPRKREY